jgi:hypothetical protein
MVVTDNIMPVQYGILVAARLEGNLKAVDYIVRPNSKATH